MVSTVYNQLQEANMFKEEKIKIGDKFGDYTVISDVYRINKYTKKVKVQCKCGEIKDTYLANLKRTTKCYKCRGVDQRKIKIGEKKHSLMCLGYSFLGKKLRFIVKCDCGNEFLICRTEFGKTKTCRECYVKKITGITSPTYKGKEYVSQTYFASILSAANRRKIPFSITIDYINSLFKEQNGLCKLTNIPIIIGNSKTKTTASLDRIDNTKGYIEGNVQWIHKDINRMKTDFEQNYFIELCKKIAENC